jgi:DNA primase
MTPASFSIFMAVSPADQIGYSICQEEFPGRGPGPFDCQSRGDYGWRLPIVSGSGMDDEVPRIPPETIEQILAANDIVEVVQGYIPLKRAGTVWKANCPFHNERTPSFSVNPQRQMFKCFGCGAGGSAIRFVMTYENLDFVSAAKKLAERAGIKIVETEMSAEDQARYGMRRRVLALHASAAEFFHTQLMKKPAGQIARDYLKGRGITGEIAKSWQLGYAPDSFEALTQFAFAEGYTAPELVESGLVKLRDEEQRGDDFYDRFRHRVMFPICNDSGEVIAFSGRVLDAEAKGGKYVNSPETMLFTKGAVLFGLHKSKRALIDKSSAIVCEGQLDLITAFEAGVTNVVAPQGTAFTEKQAHKLKQYVEEVVLCFDSDAAGEKAAERSLEHLLRENLTVRVAEMLPGEDPDSMIRTKGAGEFTTRIAAAKDFFDFQIDRLGQRPDFDTPRGKLQAARRMAGWISLITDTMLREAVMHKVSTRLELSMQEFVKLLKTPRAAPVETDDGAAEPREPIRLPPLIRLLAVVALRDAPARAWLLGEPWRQVISNDPEGVLLAKILEARLTPGDAASTNAFLATLDAEEEACVSGLLDDKPPANAMTIAHDCWRDLERREIGRRIDALQARLRAPGVSIAEVAKLQKEVLDLQKRRSDIARPLSPPF